MSALNLRLKKSKLKSSENSKAKAKEAQDKIDEFNKGQGITTLQMM